MFQLNEIPYLQNLLKINNWCVDNLFQQKIIASNQKIIHEYHHKSMKNIVYIYKYKLFKFL
jgi:hypothetical protein